MHLTGKPVASFDPEGLIFSVGVESKMVKLYDLRSFDKVCDAGTPPKEFVLNVLLGTCYHLIY